MSTAARVLVVDDERALRRLLRLYLAREGFAIAEADNGADALSLFRSGGIDIALVDVMLPQVDGFEVVRRIRRESTIRSKRGNNRRARDVHRAPTSAPQESCMNAIAAQLAPEEMSNVAAYFAAANAKSELLPHIAKTRVSLPEKNQATFIKYHTVNFPAAK